MLPSFRLIAATFFCGFLMVFAGLRLAASLNDFHEGLPVMAAHAAPVSITPVADQDLRRALTAVPVMYDLRFAVSRVTPTPASVSNPVTERAAPIALPLTILPPENTTQDAAPEAAAAEQSVAAITPEAPVSRVPAATAIQVPAEASKIEASKTETPVVAAIAPQPVAAPEPAAIVPGISVPTATVPSLESRAPAPAPVVKAAAIDPQTTPELEAAEQLVPEPDTTASVDAPANTLEPDAVLPKAVSVVPQPKPPVAKPATANPKAHAKAKVVRKKRIRTARTAPTASSFGSTSSTGNPFGTP